MPFEYAQNTPQELMGLLQVVKPETTFWLDRFYNLEYRSDKRHINFDVIYEKNRVAKFVLPKVISKSGTQTGYETRQYTPAYIKEKDEVTLETASIRRAGEPFNSNLTNAQRFAARKAEIVLNHRNRIRSRWNWMAAKAAIYGQVTISGDEYPATTIDFGRDPNLTVTLVGSQLWTSSASKPLDLITEMNQRSYDLCNRSPTAVMMGRDALKAFLANDSVKEYLDANKRYSSSSVEAGPGDSSPYYPVGQFNNVTVWSYSEGYFDENEAHQLHLDPRDIWSGSADAMKGIRCFGAIQEVNRSGLVELQDIFVKEIITEEPSSLSILSQSAPLMLPMQPNATWRARVVE